MLHPRHQDNRAGHFEVTLEFGPNILNGTVNESGIASYEVYIALSFTSVVPRRVGQRHVRLLRVGLHGPCHM